jgi:hypothetical protein
MERNSSINCQSQRGASTTSNYTRFDPAAFAIDQLVASEKTLDLEKPRRPGKFVAMRWRANFFKDLVNSEGRASTSLQRSIEISRAKNIDHAVEVAKRRYERICHVPIWSLYADRLELESKGQRILYRPTHDEIALTRIPGREKGGWAQCSPRFVLLNESQ